MFQMELMYLIDDNNVAIRKLQMVEFRILEEVVRILEEENIRYYLLGGSFLGAVRHKGFIPWDDDIDIGIPRPDYDRFYEIANKRLKQGLVYRNFRAGNEDTVYFSRVEDSSVKVKDSSAIESRVRNAWIDIFPLDGMPDNAIMRRIHQFRLLFLRVLLQYSQFSIIVNQDLPGRPLHEKLLIDLGNIIDFEKHLDTKKCMHRLDSALRKYGYDESSYVVNFMGAYKFREMFPKEIYDDACEYEFEGSMFTAPRSYDSVLKQMYGDYMKLPPEEERNKHHTEIV